MENSAACGECGQLDVPLNDDGSLASHDGCWGWQQLWPEEYIEGEPIVPDRTEGNPHRLGS